MQNINSTSTKDTQRHAFLVKEKVNHPKSKLIRVTTVPLSLKVLLRQQLHFMSAHYNVLAVSSPGKLLEEVGVNEGVKTFPVSMTRAITPLQDIKALWQLYKLFKKEQPEIVHTHTPKAGLLGMIASKLAGVPIRLHTVAGLPLMENKGIKRKVLEYVEWITYACASKVYPNSSNLAQFIIKNRFCKKDKIKVLGNGSSNGINTTLFSPTPEIEASADKLKRELNLTDKDFVFVFVGRLVRDKGIEELIEAFSALKRQYNHIKLLLVGPFEPELDPLSPLALQEIQTNKDIINVGFQQDIRPYLALSHALAFPSYREGFPNVPMQAGCMHLPSIVTNINGCNEIIEEEKNGLIIPAKDAAALQNSMERLLSDQQLYQQLKTNARSMIVARYDQEFFWNILLKEYQDQLSKHALVS
jgi:glycosyltransferase involved in cell wall biosynthesis